MNKYLEKIAQQAKEKTKNPHYGLKATGLAFGSAMASQAAGHHSLETMGKG